jgi:hypothetical protein
MPSLNSWAKTNTCSVTCQTHSSKQAPQYHSYHHESANFATRNVPPANYVLKYNIMPYVGVLTYGEAVRSSEAIAFPPAQSRQ